MPADQNKRTERLIAEPLCVRLGIDRTSAQAATPGNNIAAFDPRAASLPPEAKRIVDALHAICTLLEGTIVMWCGRPHKIVRPHPANPTKGTQLIGRAGAERAGQIVLAPVDQSEQHIFTKFAVIPNGKYAPGKPPFFLECEGNPTTLMTGNNVLPVTSRNPKTKALERYPSSAHNVMTTLNRLLFRFLKDIAAQAIGSDTGLFEPGTLQAIENGDFAIVHIQWCCYLQADVSRFLQVMVALFAPPTATDVGFSTLAQQMGLRFDYETDERSTRVKAAIFEKRHGKNSAWSAGFFNKRKRVGNMRQGLTLSDDENNLIDNNVRFDMTAHTIGIIHIINAAISFLRDNREQFTQLPETRWSNDFLSKKPKPTARWLEFAVFILSHRVVQGTMRRGSFANYLVPFFLGDVLNLRSVVCCSVEGLRALETMEHPVAKAWREDESYETQGWALRLANAAGYDSDTVVYECQREWLKAYKVNITIPRAYYRDLRLHAAISLLQDEERETYQSARDQGDGEKRLRVLDKADENLFAQVRKFVASAIQNPPTLLRAKVMGEVAGISGQSSNLLTTCRAPVARLGSPTKQSSAHGGPLQQLMNPISYSDVAETKKSPSTSKESIIPASAPQVVYYPKIILQPPRNGLHNGVDKGSSLFDLHKALAEVDKKLAGHLTAKERDHYEDQYQNIELLIERREQITKQQKQTTIENKKMARLKWMGGPLRARPSPKKLLNSAPKRPRSPPEK